MTFVKKNKFWFWFVAALMIAVPVFVGADIHFTKQGGGGDITGGGAVVVANIVGLRAFEPNGTTDPEVAILAGWTAADDGGEGTFRWDSVSVLADDSCVIIKPTTAVTGRWVRVVEKDTISILWCGNTTSDVKGPFELAITAAMTHDIGIVQLPAGTYSTAGTINIASRSDLTIDGAGAQITQTSDVTSTFLITGSTNVQIRNLKLIGKGSDWTGATSAARGINITTSQLIKITNCNFENHSYAGIAWTTTGEMHILDNTIVGTGNRVATDNFEFCVAGLGSGIGYDKVRLERNDCSDVATGFLMDSDFTDVRINGNSFNDMLGEHGIYLGSMIDALITENIIVNTNFHGMKIQLDGNASTLASKNVIFSDNVIVGTGSWGILSTHVNDPQQAGVENINHLITNNVLADGNSGITVRLGTNNRITNNTLQNMTSFGIDMRESSGEISNNNISQTGNEPIFVDVGSAPASILIKANYIYDAPTNGSGTTDIIEIIGIGTVDIEGNTAIKGTADPRYSIISATATTSLRDNIFPLDLLIRLAASATNLSAVQGNTMGNWWSYGAPIGQGTGRGKDYFGTAAPASGTYTQGDRAWNTSPSAVGILMWICTTSGTPGTWTAVNVN